MAIDPQKAAEASERAAEAAERRARAERAASEYQSTGLSFQKISKDQIKLLFNITSFKIKKR